MPLQAERVRAASQKTGGLDLLLQMDTADFAGMVADTAAPDDIAAEANGIPATMHNKKRRGKQRILRERAP